MSQQLDPYPLPDGPLRTSQQAIDAAMWYALAPEEEWLCALYLDACHVVCGWGVHHMGQTCPTALNVEEVFTKAVPYKPASLVTVRYLPHTGPIRLKRARQRATQLLKASDMWGVPLRDYIVTLLDGSRYSFREDDYTVELSMAIHRGAGV